MMPMTLGEMVASSLPHPPAGYYRTCPVNNASSELRWGPLTAKDVRAWLVKTRVILRRSERDQKNDIDNEE